jgi:hypothetical protein
MFLKLLTAIIILVAAGMLVTGRRIALPGRPTQTPAPAPRVPQAEDLVKCVRCGVWLPAGQRCSCPSGSKAGHA